MNGAFVQVAPLLWLLVAVSLEIAGTYLLKLSDGMSRRLPGAGFRPADGLRVVASLQLGAQERAVVVEVGGQQLLLGVTAAGISRLHELPQPLPPAEPARLPNLKDLPNFAQLLSQRLRKDA